MASPSSHQRHQSFGCDDDEVKINIIIVIRVVGAEPKDRVELWRQRLPKGEGGGCTEAGDCNDHHRSIVMSCYCNDHHNQDNKCNFLEGKDENHNNRIEW